VDSTTIIGIGCVLITALNLWVLYVKSKSDAELKSLGSALAMVVNKQTEHDNKFVTDQRVRDIVKDEIRPLKDEITQMNSSVRKIVDSVTALTTELKVSNAIRDYEKTNKKEVI
jgi:sensor domain CHASE-containing protein